MHPPSAPLETSSSPGVPPTALPGAASAAGSHPLGLKANLPGLKALRDVGVWVALSMMGGPHRRAPSPCALELCISTGRCLSGALQCWHAGPHCGARLAKVLPHFL